MHIKVCLFFVSLMVLLSGCGKRRAYPPHSEALSEVCIEAGDHASQEHVLDEARLMDVSLPLNVTAYDHSQKKEQTVVYYKAPYTSVMLRDFYQFDMERLGWHELMDFPARDAATALLFEKPNKWCVITIHEYDAARAVVMVYVSPKVHQDSEEHP